MSDIEIAKREIKDHSICFCFNGEFITDDGKGISPMIKLISCGKNLKGFSVADLIVGKAAAMLFVKAGIVCVHGKVMSKSAIIYLEKHNVKYSYDDITDMIINRQGTDICPMEKAVSLIDDYEEGYFILQKKFSELRSKVRVK